MPIVNVYKEKVMQNAYIGEVYEYSYDFKGKTITNLTNDGWITTGTPTLDSNGFTSTSGYDASARYTVDLSNAKKITLKSNILYSGNTQGISMSFGVVGTSKNAAFSISSSGSYGGIRVQTVISGTVTQGNNLGGVGASSGSPEFIIDLDGKTMSGTFSTYGTSTMTLTDAMVSAIRSCDKMYFYTTQHNYYIQDVSITIE